MVATENKYSLYFKGLIQLLFTQIVFSTLKQPSLQYLSVAAISCKPCFFFISLCLGVERVFLMAVYVL